MEQNPPISAVRSLVEELTSADAEHPDVAVADESGWTLSAFAGGRVVWENANEDGEPRHLEHVDRDRLIAMFQALARSEFATIEDNPWMSGY